MNTINYGIDLGTSNSAISKFENGKIKTYQNPSDYGRNTMPSVVSFRGQKIIVGSKAKDAKKPLAFFKRKMGSTETVANKTPIELSSLILKELKTFVTTAGEAINTAVITIPSSFDTIQSNATLEASKQAGLEGVVLLQEPIAASLAYANQGLSIEKGKWLVYDLGGGTFDVALLEIKDGEMRVIDHEGNNFQGGADYDSLIIKQLIVPTLERELGISNLWRSLTSKNGKYAAAYSKLMTLAEAAKIELSSAQSSEIIVDGVFEDEELDITITLDDFNGLIKPSVEETITMINAILTRNNLVKTDVSFILMVGGSTYIPEVRNRVEQSTGVEVKTDIDPTTAVSIGAAYYAGTKEIQASNENSEKKAWNLDVKTVYNKASKEEEELFSAKVLGDANGLNYRITRNDKGYDSGIIPLKKRISEDVPLVKDTFNFFTLTITNETGDVVYQEEFGINSGFAVAGQPLPEDICVEIDDLETKKTKLHLMFQKNSTLPLKRTVTFPINRELRRGDANNSISINVLEGDHQSHPASNKRIGAIVLSGKQVNRDITPGSEIEIILTMDESRTLTVEGYLVQADQEVKKIFNPKERETDIVSLKGDVDKLSDELDHEISMAEDAEDYEKCSALKQIREDLTKVHKQTHQLSDDDATDNKFSLEDKKRAIARKIDAATKDKFLNEAIANYQEAKEEIEETLMEVGNNDYRRSFERIIAKEESVLDSKSITKINNLIREIHNLEASLRWESPKFLKNLFIYLFNNREAMINQSQATGLFSRGERAIEANEWSLLADICRELIQLMPKNNSEFNADSVIGFGL